ncbi:MAG TPA: SIS domain-containing protein [Vicinamibacterales bacterium]
MTVTGTDLSAFVAERLVARNPLSRGLFDREADRLAGACEEMAGRFQRGGRLLAFGRGAAATDAQHVSVEFVHPVIVGKRALPALDLSAAFAQSLPVMTTEADIVMGFAPPAGDPDVDAALAAAGRRGAQTFGLCAPARFQIETPTRDPFVSQELIEVLYHTLWETVHVFFEHGIARPHPESGAGGGEQPAADDGGLGASAFLYPFLDGGGQDLSTVAAEVAASIRMKAADDERLREEVAGREADRIADAIATVRRRLDAGGTLLMFGNGGSATDANDWAIDCVSPPAGAAPVRALSLSMEPASISAVANDIGAEAIFLRQLIAHGRSGDIAVAISTSGGSANVIAALEEARKRRMLTVALLGYDGGEIVRRGLVDLPIVVRCDYIPRIQEVQASIYHVMTEAWQ